MTRLWAYVLTLVAAAAAAWLALAHGEPALDGGAAPWWAIALGFAAAELCVVHVEFRRSAHSFSLGDVPFVLGLIFASGHEFVFGALVGTAAVMVLHRRLPP